MISILESIWDENNRMFVFVYYLVIERKAHILCYLMTLFGALTEAAAYRQEDGEVRPLNLLIVECFIIFF